jgi:tRNA (guanine37-N1)-methyltransferase
LLREIAKALVGEEVARLLWKRVEIIGDIAVLRRPVGVDIDLEVFRQIATELIRRYPNIKSVWLAVTPVRGSYRVRDYIHLAGERRTETLYREHGCVFKVDIAKVYISPALNYEHIRVARSVRGGEEVLNMFAGAGLFSIIIAKHSRPRLVVSVDINPHAYELMVENVKLNKVEGVVIPVLGDAKDVARAHPGRFDRVLMPLPELAFEYFEYAVCALKSSGFIHVYDFISAEREDEALERAQEKYLGRCKELGATCTTSLSRVVRSVGPRYYQVVLDLYVEKSSRTSS